ncbi:MAG: DUF3617 domain-containing protein [Gammaproteobacteria bacterium]
MRIAAGLGILALSTAVVAADPGMQPGRYDYEVKMEVAGVPYAMPAQKFQSCVTQADADAGKQYRPPRNEQQCEVKDLKQSAGKASFTMACKDGTTGTAEYAFTPTGMTGKTVITTQGQAMTMNMTAKRIGDCK